MATADRKQREKLERRQVILDAAQRLFIEQGFDKMGMRNIADAVEYSVGAIYLYFKDKNELLFALQDQAFDRLAEEFDALGAIPHPADRLNALAHKYLTFAFEHPELFELMFLMNGPMEAAAARGNAMPWARGHAAFQRVIRVIQAGMEAGVFRQRDAQSAALMVWAQVHGLAALYLRQRLVFLPEEGRQPAIEEAMSIFSQLIQQSL